VTPQRAQELCEQNPGAFIVEAPDRPEALYLAKQRLAEAAAAVRVEDES
jgi:hypothetical protein